MTTYRASLGTRGELRRIAAEAETATIERVRPWDRKIQPCKLAPHVIVPQWIRSELPPKPRPAPTIVSEAQIVVAETLEALLEVVCSQKLVIDTSASLQTAALKKVADDAIAADAQGTSFAQQEGVQSGQHGDEPLLAPPVADVLKDAMQIDGLAVPEPVSRPEAEPAAQLDVGQGEKETAAVELGTNGTSPAELSVPLAISSVVDEVTGGEAQQLNMDNGIGVLTAEPPSKSPDVVITPTDAEAELSVHTPADQTGQNASGETDQHGSVETENASGETEQNRPAANVTATEDLVEKGASALEETGAVGVPDLQDDMEVDSGASINPEAQRPDPEVPASNDAPDTFEQTEPEGQVENEQKSPEESRAEVQSDVIEPSVPSDAHPISGLDQGPSVSALQDTPEVGVFAEAEEEALEEASLPASVT